MDRRLRTRTRAPRVTFRMRVRNPRLRAANPFQWADVTSSDLFDGRAVVVFAVPGAFTPTCTSAHLPGYETCYEQLRAHGVDEVYCLSVNDAFTMFQWARALNVRRVKMLPDGNAEFTRKMGALVKKENLGFGRRSWRYSMLVVDGNIERIFIERGLADNCPTDPFRVSDAPTMLKYVKSRAPSD